MLCAAVVASSEVEDNFDYYVDFDNGSDSAAGTKADPFLTPEHAVSVLDEGEGVGVCGSERRLTPVAAEPEFHGSLELLEPFQRIGVYGPQVPAHEYPRLESGVKLTTWREVPVAGTGTDKLEGFGGFESWASTTDANGWTEGTTTNGKVAREDSKLGGGGSTHALRLDILSEEPNIANVDRTFAFTANELKFVDMERMLESVHPDKQFSIEVAITSGEFNGYILQADGTWSKTAHRISVSPHQGPTYGRWFYDFKMPNGAGNCRFRIIRGSGDVSVYVDNLTLKEPVSGSGIYRTPLPQYHPSMLTWFKAPMASPEPLNEGIGPAAALAEMEWYFDATEQAIFLNLGGADPATGTVEINVSDPIDCHSRGCRITGLEFRHTYDRAIRFRKSGCVLANYKARFASSIGNGGVSSQGGTDGNGEEWNRASRGHYEWSCNDAVWFGTGTNLQADFIVGWHMDTIKSLVHDPTSDLVQGSWQSGGDVGYFRVKDCFSDRLGTLSGKGHLIFHGDDSEGRPAIEGHGKVRRIVGFGGNFGVSTGIEMDVADCCFVGIGKGTNWGSGAPQCNDIEGLLPPVKVRDVRTWGRASAEEGTLGGNGMNMEGGTTEFEGWDVADCLLVNCSNRFINMNSTKPGGKFERIRMAKVGGVPNPVRHINVKNTARTPEGLTIDNNIYPSDGAELFQYKGSNYNFAGYKAASGYDAHSKIEDLDDAAVKAEFDEHLQRLTRRILGYEISLADTLDRFDLA